jgi:hypothetical protein
MLRKLKWQLPGEPLAALYNWCQGAVPGRGLAVEKHWCKPHILHSYSVYWLVQDEVHTTQKAAVNFTLEQALKAQRGRRGIALLFVLPRRYMGGWSTTCRFTPGNDAVPIALEGGCAHGRYGQVRKISPSQGFDPRTVQPVASRYSDYAI